MSIRIQDIAPEFSDTAGENITVENGQETPDNFCSLRDKYSVDIKRDSSERPDCCR